MQALAIQNSRFKILLQLMNPQHDTAQQPGSRALTSQLKLLSDGASSNQKADKQNGDSPWCPSSTRKRDGGGEGECLCDTGAYF